MQDLGGFGFSVDANIAGAERALDNLARRADQTVAGIQRSFSSLQIKIDTSQAEQAAARLEGVLGKIKTVEVKVDVKEAQTAVENSINNIKRKAEAATASIPVTANTQQAQQNIGRFEQFVRNILGLVLPVTARTQEAEQGVRSMVAKANTEIERTKAIRPKVDVQEAESGLKRFADTAASAFSFGAGFGAFNSILNTITQSIIGLTQASVGMNAQLETNVESFKVFTGSMTAAQSVIEDLRKNADITPFDTQEVIQSGRIFNQVMQGNIALTKQMVEAAEQLAATNMDPNQGGGLQGATIALREALSGDFTSVRERFNISNADIERMKQLGLSGKDLADALIRAAGGSKQLLDTLGQTFTGRLSTVQAAFAELTRRFGEPIFAELSRQLQVLGDYLAKNGDSLGDLAQRMGGQVVEAAKSAAEVITGVANALKAVYEWYSRLQAQARTPGSTGAATTQATTTGATGGTTTSTSATSANTEATKANATSKHQLTEADKQHQEQSGKLATAIQDATKAINANNKSIEDAEKNLRANASAQATVTASYREQTEAIKRKIEALDAEQRVNAARQADIANRAEAAKGSIESRAQAAYDEAIYNVNKQILDNKNRQRDITLEIKEAERAAANELAGHALDIRERNLEARRREITLIQEARRIEIEGIQETSRQHAESRRNRMEALQEEIRGAQEARQARNEQMQEELRLRAEARQTIAENKQEEIRAITEARQLREEQRAEEIRSRRETYDLGREQLQRERQDRNDAFSDDEHRRDRAHTQTMQNYQDQIERLQQQTREKQRQSEAQTQITALTAQEAEYHRQIALADAQRQVEQSTTLIGRQDAARRVSELQQQQAFDRQRESLQEKIAADQKAADDRRAEIADKVAALQQKSQDEDRRYQREKDARDEARYQQSIKDRDADKLATRAEAELRRAEDAETRRQQQIDKQQDRAFQAEQRNLQKQQREEERADAALARVQAAQDRAQERDEQRRLREQEKADRLAERAEAEALRQKEVADRNATRAENKQLQAEALGIQQSRQQLADSEREASVAAAARRLQDLKDAAAIELPHLQSALNLLQQIDRVAAATATKDKVNADEVDRRITAQKDALTRELAEIDAALQRQLQPWKDQEAGIKLAVVQATAYKDVLVEAERAAKSIAATFQASTRALQGQANNLDDPSSHSVQVIPGVTDSSGPSTANPGAIKLFWEELVRQIKIENDLQAAGGPDRMGRNPSSNPFANFVHLYQQDLEDIAAAIGAVIDGSARQRHDEDIKAAAEAAAEAARKAAEGPVQGPPEPSGGGFWESIRNFFLPSTVEAAGLEPGDAEQRHDSASDPLLAAPNGQQLADQWQAAWAAVAEKMDEIKVEIDNRLKEWGMASIDSGQLGGTWSDQWQSAWAILAPELDAISAEIDQRISAWGTTSANAEVLGALLANIWQTAWANSLAPELDAIGAEIAARVQVWGVGEGQAETIGQYYANLWQTVWADSLAPELDAIGEEINKRVQDWGSTADVAEAIGAKQADNWQNIWANYLSIKLDEIATEIDLRVQAWGSTAENVDIIGNAFYAMWQDIWARYISVKMDEIGVEINLRMTAQGTAAADAFSTGFSSADWTVGAAGGMNALKEALNVVIPSFAQWGAAAAAHFQSGFANAMAAWSPPQPQQQPQYSGSNQPQPRSGSTTQQPSRQPPPYNYYQHLEEQRQRLPPVSYQHGTTFVPEDMLALLHKGEAVIPAALNILNQPRQTLMPAAPVISDQTARSTQAQPVKAGPISVSIGSISVSVDGASGDPREIAQQIGPMIVEELVVAMEQIQSTVPSSVPRHMTGAL